MTAKTLVVTLLIDIDDYTADERRWCAAEEGCTGRDIPRLKDFSVSDIAAPLSGLLLQTDELFSGTGIYAKFKKCAVLTAAWLPTNKRGSP